MPLSTPPEVLVHDTWHQLEADPERTADDVAAGGRSMTVREVHYWRWTARLDDEPAEVFRLLVAGSAVTSPPAGAVVVQQGVHTPRLRHTGTPEVHEWTSDPFTVGG